MAAMARLNRIWQCNTVSFASEFKLYMSLLTSILLDGCETWTLLADSENKGARLSNKVQNNRPGENSISFSVGPREPPLATVERRKLAGFRHVTYYDSLSKTILQGTLEVGRRRGQQKKCWPDNATQWTSLPMPELLTRTSCRKDWKIFAESSLTSPGRLNRTRN